MISHGQILIGKWEKNIHFKKKIDLKKNVVKYILWQKSIGPHQKVLAAVVPII